MIRLTSNKQQVCKKKKKIWHDIQNPTLTIYLNTIF